ncbi:MAG: GAF domain-containing protein, partial [Acidobacteriota bacterium]
VLAVASLARAVSGEAELADVGALTWMMLRQVVPATAMALFTHDETGDAVVAEYAVGAHAAAIHGTRVVLGDGIAGWAAANRRFVLNADPAIDIGMAAAHAAPALRASLTVPLLHEGALVGVVSLYAQGTDAFSADHARLLALLSPSLAMSVAVLPQDRAWTAAKPEPLRPAAGELRLLKRRT